MGTFHNIPYILGFLVDPFPTWAPSLPCSRAEDERHVAAAEQFLSEAPNGDGDGRDDAVRLVLKLPTGERVERTFNAQDETNVALGYMVWWIQVVDFLRILGIEREREIYIYMNVCIYAYLYCILN